MSVGIGILGREVTFTLGGSVILGTLSKGLTFIQELGDSSDDQSAGWAEFIATALKKSLEFSISGSVKNLELVQAFFGASQIYPVIITFPDGTGSTITFDAAMTTAPTYTMDNDVISTYEVGFTSSGVVVFAAGT